MSKEEEDSKEIAEIKEEVMEDEDVKEQVKDSKKEVSEEVEEEEIPTHVFEEGVDKTEDIPEGQESNYGI